MQQKLTGKIFNIQKFSINDGPGIRSVVFFCGCPLACKWCANPESQNGNIARAAQCGEKGMVGRKYTVEEVLFEVEKDRCFYEESGGGITLSGGEALQQHRFSMALLREAHARGLHCAVETTGYVQEDIFREFLPHVDLFLFDVKHFCSAKHMRGTGVDNAVILKNLHAAMEYGTPLIARIPVIPGFNFSPEDGAGLADLLRREGVQEAHLLPFHQFGEKKYEQLQLPYEMRGVKQLHPEDLQDYLKLFLDLGLNCSIR